MVDFARATRSSQLVAGREKRATEGASERASKQARERESERARQRERARGGVKTHLQANQRHRRTPRSPRPPPYTHTHTHPSTPKHHQAHTSAQQHTTAHNRTPQHTAAHHPAHLQFVGICAAHVNNGACATCWLVLYTLRASISRAPGERGIEGRGKLPLACACDVRRRRQGNPPAHAPVRGAHARLSTVLRAGAVQRESRSSMRRRGRLLARGRTVKDAVAMGIEVLAQILVAAHSVRMRMQRARDVEELGHELALQILRRLPLPLVAVGVLAERKAPQPR